MKSVLHIAPTRPDATVDLTPHEGPGGRCPVPLLEAIRALNRLRAGEVLLLVSDCPGTKDDLFAWVEQTRNQILRIETLPSGRTGFLVRKGWQPAPVVHVTLDARGVACPGPVVEARRILTGLLRGKVLKLVSSCTAARAEVNTWISGSGHELLETREIENGAREFYIRRG